MIRFWTVLFLLAASAAYAQTPAPSPAQMGITPTTSPEVLQVLDAQRHWTPIGNVDPNSHTFMLPQAQGGTGTSNPTLTAGPNIIINGTWPNQTISATTSSGSFGEADILVTDPTVGMASGGLDNSPFVQNLMNKMGPPVGSAPIMGYDVTFPSVPGQNYTGYYFSQPLVLSRGARYHCSGAAGASSGGYASTYLVFPAGVDGVIQEDKHWTADGGMGGGTIDGCGIIALGHGVGYASANASGTPAANTQITSVSSQTGDLAGVAPPDQWNAGDGVLITPGNGAYYPAQSIPAVSPGAYISAVSGTAGNYTLTLASPYVINQFFSAATITFLQTGQNNFVNGDQLTVGNTTLNMVTTLGSTPGNVVIGSDWYVTTTRIAAALNGTACSGCYVAPSTTPNVMAIPPISNRFAFWSKVTGAAGNGMTATYTPAGTAAGAFQGSFASGYDLNTISYYHFPVSQVFTVQTTTGSSTVTVTAGPRPMRPGDAVWSDAFPLGTVVLTVTPAFGFPQTVTMNGPFDNTAMTNASVTHSSGAPGQWWVLPKGLKRSVIAGASNNAFFGWPIGLAMICSTANNSFLNCDISHDSYNTFYGNFIGRWTGGNNVGGSSSTNDSFGKNYFTDVLDGGTIGETYFDLHSETPENGQGPYNLIGNCVNGSGTSVLGGYQGGGGLPDCANQTDLTIPPTTSGFLRVSPVATRTALAPVITNGFMYNSWQNRSGMNGQDCVAIGRGSGGGSPFGGWYDFAVSNAACSTPSTLGLNWNVSNNNWDWVFAASTVAPLKLFYSGYAGYGGIGYGIGLPYGAIFGGDGSSNTLSQSRLFGMTNNKPTANWHLSGDTEINTSAAPGGQGAWFYTSGFNTTLTAAVTKGSTTSVTVAACPTVAPQAGSLVQDTNGTLAPQIILGVYSSCTAGTLTFTAAALNSSVAANDAIKIIYPYGAMLISNDPANPDYTITALRSGSSVNKDITGRISLSAGTATYTLTGVYASAPNCLCADATTPANACSVSESTTTLTFTGTGTDSVKWHCVGRN